MMDSAKIKAYRARFMLTMEEAAHRAGFASRQRWYDLESGRARDPQVSTAYAIACALNTTIDDLILKPGDGMAKAETTPRRKSRRR